MKTAAISFMVVFLLMLLPGPAWGQDEKEEEAQVDAILGPGPETASPPRQEDKKDFFEQVRGECRAGADCAHLPELIRLLWTADKGVRAAALLGELGDVRAVVPLALVSVYGPSEEVRREAGRVLGLFARRSEARGIVEGLAKDSPDPAVRRAAREVIPTEAAPAPKKPDKVAAPPALKPKDKKPGKGVKAGPRKKKPRTFTGVDPEATRVIYSLTAFGRETGDASWNIFDLGLWYFDFGVSENLQAGFTTVVPIAVMGIIPHIKLNMSIGESVHFAVFATAGAAFSYAGGDWYGLVYGGGPVLTFGNRNALLNISFPVYGFSDDRESTWIMTPSLGAGFRLSERTKLNFELHFPIAEFVDNFEFWLLFYGVRIFGEKMYGDISFVLPIFDGMGDILQFTPFGFPLLGFGFQW